MSECGGQGAGCGLRAGEVGSGPAASAVGRVGASAAGARPPPHPPPPRREAPGRGRLLPAGLWAEAAEAGSCSRSVKAPVSRRACLSEGCSLLLCRAAGQHRLF